MDEIKFAGGRPKEDSRSAIIKVMEMIEHRAEQRYALALSIVLRRGSSPKDESVFYGTTHNISTRGIYFTTDQPLTVDETLDFSLIFPGLAQGADVLVNGRAKILRLMGTSEPIAAAAVIENFQIVQA